MGLLIQLNLILRNGDMTLPSYPAVKHQIGISWLQLFVMQTMSSYYRELLQPALPLYKPPYGTSRKCIDVCSFVFGHFTLKIQFDLAVRQTQSVIFLL